MELSERIGICKTCQKCKRDRRGIVCGLTNEKPTFEVYCAEYEEDEAAVSAVLEANLHTPPAFIQAIKDLYKDSFDYEGRSKRSEFWWAMLYLALTSLTYLLIQAFLPSVIVLKAWLYVNVGPTIALWIRRCHDVGISGWVCGAPWLLSAVSVFLLSIDILPETLTIMILLFVNIPLWIIPFIGSQKRDNKWGRYICK